MEKQKQSYALATPEMVNKLVDDFYSDTFSKMDFLLKNIAGFNKSEIDVEKIVADKAADRERLIGVISEYEDELAQMLDLATVLLEHRSTEHGNNDGNLDGYINYLLEKNIEVLPDIIEIIQMLKK